MGGKWEAFVADVDGKPVGGGMYIGRGQRMTITFLMVDPAYRRRGIGRALLVKRLERLKERGFPFVAVQVLETNQASLGNLRQQGFDVFNQYTVYERRLPLPMELDGLLPAITVRRIHPSDRALFRDIERESTHPFVLYVRGEVEPNHFRSVLQKVYMYFLGYANWFRAFEVQEKTVGFLAAESHKLQRKAFVMQPMLSNDNLHCLPSMIHEAGAWAAAAGKESLVMTVPDQHSAIRQYLLDNGWEKQYTWLNLVKWLDEDARLKYFAKS